MRNVVTKLGKSLGLAGALVTISDLMQPIAPLSAYVLAVSGISLVILLIAKLYQYLHILHQAYLFCRRSCFSIKEK